MGCLLWCAIDMHRPWMSESSEVGSMIVTRSIEAVKADVERETVEALGTFFPVHCVY